MPCSFCGVDGHGIDVCPDRLEEKFGHSQKYDADGSVKTEGETDGA